MQVNCFSSSSHPANQLIPILHPNLNRTYPPYPPPPTHPTTPTRPPFQPPPTTTTPPHPAMFATRLLSASARTFKARHPWPPNFSLLSKQDQFRLERRYRRRAKLKWARPRLQKAITIAQWASISCTSPTWGIGGLGDGVKADGGIVVAVYGVFWADWGSDHIFMPVSVSRGGGENK